jgi:hypothetical protein
MSKSEKLDDVKEKLGAILKKGGKILKKGTKVWLQEVRNLYEDFGIDSDPNKTIYKYEQTFPKKINKRLINKENENLSNWKNYVIMLLNEAKFKEIEQLFNTIEDDTDTVINSITFRASREVKYNPNEQSFWRQELSFLDSGEDRKFWESEKPNLWDSDYKKKMAEYEQKKKKAVEKEISVSPTSSELKSVTIFLMMTFFIDYKQSMVSLSFLLDYGDPQIVEINPKLTKNLKRLGKSCVKELGRLLYNPLLKEPTNPLTIQLGKVLKDNKVSIQEIRELEQSIDDLPERIREPIDDLLKQALREEDEIRRLAIIDTIKFYKK